MRLVDEIGFDPVDAGTIDDSWRQQPATPVYTTDYDAERVRKALGASRFNILFQFLVEALVLCLAGGTVGVILGSVGAVLLSRLAHWNTSISVFAILLAFLFSAIVGLVFGVWPARRASLLDPIVALRYE